MTAMFCDRYASAVHSGDLGPKPETSLGDVDFLGAAGIAARRHPLALALQRLFSGDNRAATEIVSLLGAMAHGKAHKMRIRLTEAEAEDMARSVLAWHRDGVCKACNGHGRLPVPGAPAISKTECKACAGGGRIIFEHCFTWTRRDLARWLLAEVEREQCVAGPEAMKALAPRLTL